MYVVQNPYLTYILFSTKSVSYMQIVTNFTVIYIE